MPVIPLGGDDNAGDPSNNGQWIQYPDGTWGPPGGGFGPYGGRSTPYAQPPGIPVTGDTSNLVPSTPNGTPGISINSILNSLNPISSAQAGELPSHLPVQPTPTPTPSNNFWSFRGPGVTATDLTQGAQKIFPHIFGGGGNQPIMPAFAPSNLNNPFTHVYKDQPSQPVGTPIGALAPGASGIVQGKGGTELLNPGPPLFGGSPIALAPRPRPTAAPVRAPAYQAAPVVAAAPQQPYSPFTMVLRPNAPAEGGGRGGGGPPLTTALDLSNWGRGYQPPPPPAPRPVNLGYGISPAATAAAPRAAPVRQPYTGIPNIINSGPVITTRPGRWPVPNNPFFTGSTS